MQVVLFVKIGYAAHPASHSTGTGCSFPLGWNSRGVMLTTYLQHMLTF